MVITLISTAEVANIIKFSGNSNTKWKFPRKIWERRHLIVRCILNKIFVSYTSHINSVYSAFFCNLFVIQIDVHIYHFLFMRYHKNISNFFSLFLWKKKHIENLTIFCFLHRNKSNTKKIFSSKIPSPSSSTI